jgi:hypothetical protein
MSSLWTDLLYLHGYITDHKLAKRWADKQSTPPPKTSDGARSNLTSKAKQIAWYARLCHGIGDGRLHWQ